MALWPRAKCHEAFLAALDYGRTKSHLFLTRTPEWEGSMIIAVVTALGSCALETGKRARKKDKQECGRSCGP